MHGKQLPWDHEIQIALPPGYDQGDARYPVLWLMDGHAIFAESLNTVRRLTTQVPRMIIVGVGVPPEAVEEFQTRRAYDFSPFDDWKRTTAPGRDVFNEANKALDEFTRQSGMGVAERAGGAPHFLSFLLDEVRPALAKKYRLADQHILFGHSSGGTFCTYALLARPEGFQKYICSSAGLYGGNGYFFELENRYARTHDDLKAEVLFAAGEEEVTQPTIAGIGLVSSTSRMAEVLTERKYPSLELRMRFFPAEDHATTLPRSLSWGLRTLLKAE
ncbi:MAG TPA: alpha/beta hydrolase-fold protein [Steroidobacter sp.]|uniref:alpha/beta hydrolase n=1 Tax=Steroidobacter sp. TaxID=1978227 RepID=UPI002ED98EDF